MKKAENGASRNSSSDNSIEKKYQSNLDDNISYQPHQLPPAILIGDRVYFPPETRKNQKDLVQNSELSSFRSRSGLCEKCGTKNSQDFKFCKNCGNSLNGLAQTEVDSSNLISGKIFLAVIGVGGSLFGVIKVFTGYYYASTPLYLGILFIGGVASFISSKKGGWGEAAKKIFYVSTILATVMFTKALIKYLIWLG